MEYCFERCSNELDRSVLFRRARYKPCGYAGDYLMLDWIYTQRVASVGAGIPWDNFFHHIAIAGGVRNRKGFFSEAFHALCNDAS